MLTVSADMSFYLITTSFVRRCLPARSWNRVQRQRPGARLVAHTYIGDALGTSTTKYILIWLRGCLGHGRL